MRHIVYDGLKLNLHNYFIVKNLDKLRPGGVAAALDRVVPGGVTGQRLRIDDRTLSCVAAGHGAPVVVLEAG